MFFLILVKGVQAQSLSDAIKKKDVATVEKLLQSGVDPENTRAPISNLNLAVESGDIRTVKLLLKYKANINISDYPGRSALTYAVEKGKIDIALYLLKSGIKVDRSKQDYPLILNCVQKGYTKIVKALLDKKISIETTGINGFTPLISASYNGKLDIVKILLQRGASVNVKSKSNSTALIIAVMQGHEPVVRILLEAKADVNIEDSTGSSALDHALLRKKTGMIKLLLAHKPKRTKLVVFNSTETSKKNKLLKQDQRVVMGTGYKDGFSHIEFNLKFIKKQKIKQIVLIDSRNKQRNIAFDKQGKKIDSLGTDSANNIVIVSQDKDKKVVKKINKKTKKEVERETVYYNLKRQIVKNITIYIHSPTSAITVENKYTYLPTGQLKTLHRNGVNGNSRDRYDFSYYRNGRLKQVDFNDKGRIISTRFYFYDTKGLLRKTLVRSYVPAMGNDRFRYKYTYY